MEPSLGAQQQLSHKGITIVRIHCPSGKAELLLLPYTGPGSDRIFSVLQVKKKARSMDLIS